MPRKTFIDPHTAEMDRLATTGLGPRFRLTMEAVHNAPCPVCEAPAGEPCSTKPGHLDRVWSYAAGQRRSLRRLTSDQALLIRNDVRAGMLTTAIRTGLLRLATSPDGPQWVRLKAIAEPDTQAPEPAPMHVWAAAMDADKASYHKVRATGSVDGEPVDIMSCEAIAGHLMLITIDGVPLRADEVRVHRSVPTEEALDTPSIAEYIDDAGRGQIFEQSKTDALMRSIKTTVDGFKDTRASIVAFIEAEAHKFEKVLEATGAEVVETDEQADNRNDKQIRLNAKASILRTMAAYIERGDDKVVS